MSGNWSSGSNYHPCSQPRKVSIGVVVDSFAKKKSNHGKGVGAELQASENATLAKDIRAENKHKEKEVGSPDLGRKNKDPCQKFAPLVHTKTSHQDISFSNVFGKGKHGKGVRAELQTSETLANDIHAESKHKGKEVGSPDLGRQNKAPSQAFSPPWVGTIASHQNISSSDAFGKGRHGKGVVAEMKTSENVTLAKDIHAESKHKRKEVSSSDLVRQNKAPSQAFSPLVGTKASHQRVSSSDAFGKGKHGKGVVAEMKTSENVTLAKGIPAEIQHKGKEVISPDLGRQNKAPCEESSPLPGGNKDGEMDPLSVFANQMFNLHARDANENESNKNTIQREGGSNGFMGRNGQFPYPTAQEAFVTGKGIAEQGTSERGKSENGTLRMKLQELLGTVYSHDKKQYNPETFGMDANDLNTKSRTKQNDSLVAMHKQQLHTREAKSGSLDHKTRRPVTRSLIGKKPRAQKPAPKKEALFCRYKQTHLYENEFSFVETWSTRPSTDVNHGSTLRKRKAREIFGTKSVKTCFVEALHKDENQQATDRRTKAAAVNVSLLEKRTRDSEILMSNTGRKEKTHYQSEVTKTGPQPGGNNETRLYDNVDQDPFAKYSLTGNIDPQSDLKSPSFELKKAAEISSPRSLTGNIDPQSDLKSPSFELKKAAEISSPRSLFQINQEDLDVDSSSERTLKTKRVHSSPITGLSRGGHNNANTMNLAMDLQDSPVAKPTKLIIDGHKENRFSTSPSKEVNFESSEDGSPVTEPIIVENCEGNRWSTSPCQENDSESSEPVSPIKGNGDCDKILDSSELDGLAGAVNLFALALERVQSKIHSVTSRQSAEIMLSVSKNIHSQLQNTESKIQNEVGKLTNLGKSKRMRTENQCQEQQEQLKRIYEKFKEEVDQHLEQCRSALEGLEARQMEVRGMVEKQRLSHRKLLLQTEEAIKAQLNDAQSQLADVHRRAREKMLKLKYGIGECLKEGLFG